MLCIHYNVFFGVPVLIIPKTAFFTPLLMSFLALIKAPSLLLARDGDPSPYQDAISYIPRDVDPSFLQNNIACSPYDPIIPAFLEPLFPTPFVTKILLFLGLYSRSSSLPCSSLRHRSLLFSR